MDGVRISELAYIYYIHKYLTCSVASVMDYIYILFWNSLWTIAPVIGVGLFDRFLGALVQSMTLTMLLITTHATDSRVLMDVPQLYHYGREGTWFGTKPFLVYMFDGILQVRIQSFGS